MTRPALAGATPPEIATFTGHSLGDINDIIDAHYYLNRVSRLTEAAHRKLEIGFFSNFKLVHRRPGLVKLILDQAA